MQRILVLTYGNPARQDEGLGPALAHALQPLASPALTVAAHPHLAVEHADALARHDVVIFVAASPAGADPYEFRRIEAGPTIMFSAHSATPEGVLTLADELFHEQPDAYVLSVRGYAFDEAAAALTSGAQSNLAAATDFLRARLAARDFDQHAHGGPRPPGGIAGWSGAGLPPCARPDSSNPRPAGDHD